MNPDLLAKVTDSTEAAIVALQERWQAGELTDDEFVALVTAAIERGQAGGVAMADLGVATALGVGAVGLLPDAAASVRAARVARTIASAAPEVDATFTLGFNADAIRERLKEPGYDRSWYARHNRMLKYIDQARMEGRAEVLDTAQRASTKAIKAHGAGWTRRPNRGACEVCISLVDQRPIPADTPMWTHKGCGCTQKPIKETREEAA